MQLITYLFIWNWYYICLIKFFKYTEIKFAHIISVSKENKPSLNKIVIGKFFLLYYVIIYLNVSVSMYEIFKENNLFWLIVLYLIVET